ncbi:MAG: polyphenol oxidase family protein [Candidatus Liptonbacteria bacterium]|nr:polyphenol oxidase family protein [Candidatus Liptonbacteria bacterium]
MEQKLIKDLIKNKDLVNNKENIINGVLMPDIFKKYDYDSEVGVGLSTKQLGGESGQEKTLAFQQATTDSQRFDQNFADLPLEKQLERIRAARGIKEILNTIYPESKKTDIAHKAIKLKLTHETTVTAIDQAFLENIKTQAGKSQKSKETSDAYITNLKDVPLIMLLADCAPIALYDPENKAIGVVHASRKTIAGEIPVKTLNKMNELYGTKPEQLVIYIGPYADGDRYEIGPEIYEEFFSLKNENDSLMFSEKEIQSIFKKSGRSSQGGEHYYLDIGKAIKYLLIKSGVSEKNIETSEYRTMKDNNLFASERVEGKENRGTNILVAVLKTKQSNE